MAHAQIDCLCVNTTPGDGHEFVERCAQFATDEQTSRIDAHAPAERKKDEASRIFESELAQYESEIRHRPQVHACICLLHVYAT